MPRMRRCGHGWPPLSAPFAYLCTSSAPRFCLTLTCRTTLHPRALNSPGEGLPLSELEPGLEAFTHPVGNAVNRNALEVVLVELLNSRLEIGSSLVLDKALSARASGVALAVDLAVDDVKSRLASEVLQVL